MDNRLQILEGDCREQIKLIPDGVIQCVVTSPPYFGLRSYLKKEDPKKPLEIGQEKTPQEYVQTMISLFQEIWRVLKPDGTVFLNLGDSYFGSGCGGNPATSKHQKQKTNRSTVGLSNARCEVAYGISGKESQDYQVNDLFCENLCDVCRAVYHRNAHNGPLLESMLLASLHVSSHANREFESVHVPTSDSSCQEVRNEVAIQKISESSNRAAEHLRASLASKIGIFSQQLLDECLQRGSAFECLLCARSLSDNVQASADKLACTCDTFQRFSFSIARRCKNHNDDPYQDYTKSSHNLKNKDLIGIPWRVALALQADGWWLRSDIIWAKPNCMPESVTDRPTRSHEYIFLLTKAERYYYDHEAIKEPSLYDVDGTGTAARKARTSADLKSYPDGKRAGIRPSHGPENNFESTLMGARTGRHNLGENVPLIDHRPQSAGYKNSVNFEGKNKGQEKQRGHSRRHDGFNDRWDLMTTKEQCSGMRNKRDVWTIPPAQYRDAHFAVFPPELITPCILAGSRPGDLVLDPFLGSGTTARVALELGRRCVGIELNRDYLPMIGRRMDVTMGLKF